jgi:uncharacterized BrkB/YihY/UPF0761 family membrane protein
VLSWLIAFGAILPIPTFLVIFALRESNDGIRHKNKVLWSRWYLIPLVLVAVFWSIWIWAPR